MNEQDAPQTDMHCYEGVPGEPMVTPETEASQWVSDAMFDAYNN